MRARKPTLKEKKILKARKLIPENWHVIERTTNGLHVVHKHSDRTKRFIKLNKAG